MRLLVLAACIASALSSLEFSFEAHMIPHPQKADTGGEDAFFASEDLLVIADGVGGWKTMNISPAEYARFLCKQSGLLFSQNSNKFRKNPLELMRETHGLNENMGSATMVLLVIEGTALRSCYVGDSGFLVIRRQRDVTNVVFETVEHQAGFNFPFQLARIPQHGHSPDEALCLSFDIQEDDIVVVGSDGLFDNMFRHEILNFVKEAEINGTLLKGLAQKMAELSIKRGNDKKFFSPFAQQAKHSNMAYIGGKLDDTTVIIAKVVTKSIASLDL